MKGPHPGKRVVRGGVGTAVVVAAFWAVTTPIERADHCLSSQVPHRPSPCLGIGLLLVAVGAPVVGILVAAWARWVPDTHLRSRPG